MADGRAELRHVVRVPPSRRSQLVALVALAAIALGLVQVVGAAPVLFVSVFFGVAWLNIAVLRKRPSVVGPHLLELEHPATLGADGLALADRFVSRSEIAKIEVDAARCIVTTHDGERLELRGSALDLARAARFAPAVAEVPRDPDGELLLTRVDVGQLRAEPAGYRGFSLDGARCLAIAEDPRAEGRARIAAAELLRDQLDDAGRVRVAAAADETAQAEVREALLASARGRQ